MSCSIQLNDEHRIVYYQHHGTIEKSNIMETWQRVLALLVHQGLGYNLILDYRDAQFVFKSFEIDEIVHFFYSSISILNNRRIAGIANHTHEVAIVKLIETLRGSEANYQVRSFTGIEEALCFLT